MNFEEFVIEKEWEEVLGDFFETQIYKNLKSFVEQEYLSKKVFPSRENIFKAFALTPFSKVKVVILGQDPYHDDNQAEGLSFSVPQGVALPPSLKNIYKEIESNFVYDGVKKDFSNGNLEPWAKQGVFLLNSILTVVAHMPSSHKKKGWEDFTDFVIKMISKRHDHVVFLLWGNYARSKKDLIDSSKHYVLEASHPSPLSSYNGFFGCNHFKLCNEYLKNNKKQEIVW